MTTKRNIKVAVAGFGTVGSGVAEIVVNRGEALAARTGLRFEITRALVSNLHKQRDAPVDRALLTDDPEALLAADMDMLVEVVGGTDTARDVVLAALRKGIPVVTANKALLALHGAEIYRTARENKTCVAFEASCAGGLPIIGALLGGLQANQNDTILGIFNSTCNFVLTAMLDRGMRFADAVTEAQQCGYAEADPTLDVSGGDTAHKLTVLASLAFGLNLDFSKIAMTGIDSLQLIDLRIARALGFACKLIGVGRRGQDRHDEIMLAVEPTLLPASHPLAGLTGTSSGVCVYGDVVGETSYAGAGAGSLPTASAVVADMIEVATGAAQATFDGLRMFNDQTPTPTYLDPASVRSSAYVRFSFDPRHADPVADVKRVLADVELRVERIHLAADEHAVAVITAPVRRSNLRTAVRMAAGNLLLNGEPVILPVLTEPTS
jgi:homoserine dehydrogenase